MVNLNKTEINDLFCKVGLYENICINVEDIESFENLVGLISREIKLDSYCIDCGKERTFFSPEIGSIQQYNQYMSNRRLTTSTQTLIDYTPYFSRKFICSMNDEHNLYFLFKLNKNTIQKIGQYPSLADLEQNNIKRYNKVLSKTDLSDLSKAIGLHAHGIGAGSYVYLRRIFEGLIEGAYHKSVSENTWDETIDFNRIDMKAKIDNLNDYIPSFLYKHPTLYSVLSAGIHSLEEKYCKDNFETLKEAIFVILDQEVRKREDMDRDRKSVV